MLDLLLAPEGASAPAVVVLHLAARADEPLAAAVLESARDVQRRLLPVPGPRAEAADVRGWYEDVWLALPEQEQESVVLGSGPGAACLALSIERETHVLATVREPREAVAAVVAAGAYQPSREGLLALRDRPGHTPKSRLRATANPQARELLVPWSEADELPVTVGPPPDADRWRELLFGEALPRLRPMAIGDLAASAPALAPQLGDPREWSTRATELAARLPSQAGELPPGPVYTELLLELNWLDGELYERCTAAQAE